MKLKNILLVSFGIISLASCNNIVPQGFTIDEKYENGNPKEVSKNCGDTFIDGNSYQLCYVIHFDANKNIERKGKCVNDYAIGNHLFFVNNKLNYIRNYIIWTKEEWKLIIDGNFMETKYSDDMKKDLTFLNDVYRISDKEDTLFNESSFVNIEILNSKIRLHDTLFANLTFHESNFNISGLEIIFQIPHDESSIIILSGPGKVCKYSYKTEVTGKAKISGFALVHGYKIHEQNDTLPVGRILRFEKDYIVGDN